MGREKRLRIAELERQRLERMANGEQEPPKLQIPKRYLRRMAGPTYYTCGKCKHQVSEGAVNAHLAKCQPKGLRCGRCRRWIIGPDFVGHMRECLNQPAVEEPKAIIAGPGVMQDPALLRDIRMQTRQVAVIPEVESKPEPPKLKLEVIDETGKVDAEMWDALKSAAVHREGIDG